MNTLFLSLAFFATSLLGGVSIQMDKHDLVVGDTLKFSVSTDAQLELEVAVFSDTKVVMIETSLLNPGKHDFSVETNTLRPGKYYVVVKGEGIHVQENWTLK